MKNPKKFKNLTFLKFLSPLVTISWRVLYIYKKITTYTKWVLLKIIQKRSPINQLIPMCIPTQKTKYNKQTFPTGTKYRVRSVTIYWTLSPPPWIYIKSEKVKLTIPHTDRKRGGKL